MNGEAIVSISAAVVALVQLVKWAGLKDGYGPLAVLLLALAGVGFWAWSMDGLTRATAFSYFAGWIAVSTSAAGVFGFSRASATALTRTNAKPPPSTGAGADDDGSR